MGLMYYKGKSILQITAKKYVEVVQAVLKTGHYSQYFSTSLQRTISLVFDNWRPVV
jgi:hypothetical protein